MISQLITRIHSKMCDNHIEVSLNEEYRKGIEKEQACEEQKEE